jgi:uncharacterized DUF497 family protein
MPAMPRFEYDASKSESNRKKHGITFKQAELIWSGDHPVISRRDNRLEYGEARFQAIGLLPNLICIVVVYTLRNRAIRIISARQAEKREREFYYEQSGYTPSL